MNSYWILWIGRLRRTRSELARWAVSAIFEKWPFVIKPYFLLFEARISCIFLIFLLRNIKAYLCPNMINFDAVDFSERRLKEVMFLLTLSFTLICGYTFLLSYSCVYPTRQITFVLCTSKFDGIKPSTVNLSRLSRICWDWRSTASTYANST